MEEGDLVRLSPLRTGGGLKSTLSGRSTPRGSPSFRRLASGRTPRREGRAGGISIHWFRSNRIVLWLLLITLWAYAAFYVQSRWAHGDNKEAIFGYATNKSDQDSKSGEADRRDLISNDDYLEVDTSVNTSQITSRKINVVLAKKENDVSYLEKVSSKKKGNKSRRSSRKKGRGKQKTAAKFQVSDVDVQEEEEIPNRNTTYGLLVGPFGSTEDRILGWSPGKRSGTCDRKSEFARLVWSRRFVLIFHELSMTGAPLAMMELATELLSCGAAVSVVVLSKKGGLMPELARRRIKVLEAREKLSFKAAMKSDLIIAGSAVCASWIEQYYENFVPGSSQVAWWIMENRREYFNRSMIALSQVRMLIFLSELQSEQWLSWCKEENIALKAPPQLVPLSVNDELAFVAGITSSLNSPSFTTEKMLEKRQLLRDSVRKEMGLTDSDILVMSLSSINPGKGQFLLLESARLLIEGGLYLNNSAVQNSAESSSLLRKQNQVGGSSNASRFSNKSFISLSRPMRKRIGSSRARYKGSGGNTRKLLSGGEQQEHHINVLIGSVGSKSNKVPYVKALLRFLSLHSNLSKSVLWTPTTTRVASLYAAADIYIMNSQGLGETFGRVTIEAMSFGLPVLGTDAGGTKEIVEHNITGLLHPLGRPGTQVLAQNLQFLLKNPSVRQELGGRGRKKVQNIYLKRHMYKKFAEILFKCMRIK